MRFFRKSAGRVTKDFLVSILSSVVYTFARQIIVFPLLAYRLTEDTYGTLLTVIGLANVCTALLGSCLNNLRLIRNSLYRTGSWPGTSTS